MKFLRRLLGLHVWDLLEDETDLTTGTRYFRCRGCGRRSEVSSDGTVYRAFPSLTCHGRLYQHD